jgi:hypothetical protein
VLSTGLVEWLTSTAGRSCSGVAEHWRCDALRWPERRATSWCFEFVAEPPSATYGLERWRRAESPTATEGLEQSSRGRAHAEGERSRVPKMARRTTRA